jgi:hypothetical protein
MEMSKLPEVWKRLARAGSGCGQVRSFWPADVFDEAILSYDDVVA